MKAGIFYGPYKIKVEEVPDPKITDQRDAIVKITYTCVCGSDLWWYRGINKKKAGTTIGHEFMGKVIKVGSRVRNIKVGDVVVGPFRWCDGTCPECKAGMSTACRNGGLWGSQGTGGCQAEQLRVPFADANLFAVPKSKQKEKLMPSLLALSDVMGTGHHAAVSAGVSSGKTVAVIGDGAVGLCAVLASKRLKARKIILLSSHPDRAKIGKKFGATDIVSERGEKAVEKVRKLTGTLGVDCALECVGTHESWKEAFGMLRAGGRIGAVGLPESSVPAIKIGDIFWRNLGVGGGPAPTRTYIPELMPDVLSGKLDPSAVFTLVLPLSKLAKGYDAMDKRKAVKVLIKP